MARLARPGSMGRRDADDHTQNIARGGSCGDHRRRAQLAGAARPLARRRPAPGVGAVALHQRVQAPICALSGITRPSEIPPSSVASSLVTSLKSSRASNRQASRSWRAAESGIAQAWS